MKIAGCFGSLTANLASKLAAAWRLPTSILVLLSRLGRLDER
jgi:hypothetical protein